MAYRCDPDLEFLSKIQSSDLEDLVFCITHDKDGIGRFTEELTLSEPYKRYAPDHNKYWDLIAAEIQCFGSNTIATMLRKGKGVLYREVLTDVCDRLKVNYSNEASIETIENNLLMKILTDALDKMSQEELQELAQTIGIKKDVGIIDITPQILTAAFQAIFRAGGFKSYQLTVMIANAVLKALIGRGLTFGGNAILTRTMSILMGPIGWVITGAWTILDIAEPAYRVTIPAVIQVAVLRQKHLLDNVSEHIDFN